MQWQAQGDTLLDIAAQVSTGMAKRNRAPTQPAEPPIDRVIGMDELSRITGLSKYALYHLRSHRPYALPPALTGDAYRNSAKYLLSTVQTWLVSQQGGVQMPPATSTAAPAVVAMPLASAASIKAPQPGAARPGRKRRQLK